MLATRVAAVRPERLSLRAVMLVETRPDYEALRRDDQMALHLGDSGRRRCRGSRRVRLLQRMHVTVELGGVVRYLNPDVARVDLRLALEGFLNHGLDALRAGRWVDDDVICHADHSAHLADHPLDLVALEAPFHLAVERDPAAFHPGVHLPLGNL